MTCSETANLPFNRSVLEGELDLRIGLGALPGDRQRLWSARIDDAEEKQPDDFRRNRWVVQSLQGAWSAITHTDATDAGQLQGGIEAAVRGGGDTGSIAGIAGGLLGARWGVAGVPSAWRRVVQGWPGLRGADLVRLAVLASQRGTLMLAPERETVRLHVLR